MNKIWLRIVWIIPNAAMYIMSIGLLRFIVINYEDLQAVRRLAIWNIITAALIIVSVYGSYRIYRWMKEGKI